MITTRREFRDIVWMYFELKGFGHRIDCMMNRPGSCICGLSRRLAGVKQMIERSAHYLGYIHVNNKTKANGDKKSTKESESKIRCRKRCDKKRKTVNRLRRKKVYRVV